MVVGGSDKEGYYCSICGGVPPDKITTKRILVDGKETGIDQLDWIMAEVRKLGLTNDAAITEELLKRVKTLNYVPTRTASYGAVCSDKPSPASKEKTVIVPAFLNTIIRLATVPCWYAIRSFTARTFPFNSSRPFSGMAISHGIAAYTLPARSYA